jgi:hypothetical protein
MLSQPMLHRWRVTIAIAAIYLYAFPYFPTLRHANELPRIVTSEQLAEHGTFRLDERMGDLGSLADVSTAPDGRRYQNKAPGLSILGVLPYVLLDAGFRLASGHRPPLMLVTWLLRVLLATLPTLAMVAYFPAVAVRFAERQAAIDGALVAFALGSMALPLGLLFMSHAIAAALVGIAFATSVAAVRERRPAEQRAAALVGTLLGLSMLCEYQALFGAVLVAGYLLSGVERRARAGLVLASTSAPFLAVLAWYHWIAFGSPFRTGYAFSVDAANRVGVMGIVGFSRLSLAQLFTRPDNGLLLLSPWVVLAAVGALRIAWSEEARARAGREACIATAIAVVYCVFVALLEPEFGRGGWSVGPRYIAVAMPFIAWLAAAGLDACLRHRTLRIAAFSLICAGVIVNVLAATTYPHWPVEFQNPLFEVTVRSLREGHAPYSLGTLLGLRGLASLVPLYAGVMALAVALLAQSRGRLPDVMLALVIAGAVVSGYERLATTPRFEADAMWRYVAATLKP